MDGINGTSDEHAKRFQREYDDLQIGSPLKKQRTDDGQHDNKNKAIESHRNVDDEGNIDSALLTEDSQGQDDNLSHHTGRNYDVNANSDNEVSDNVAAAAAAAAAVSATYDELLQHPGSLHDEEDGDNGSSLGHHMMHHGRSEDKNDEDSGNNDSSDEKNDNKDSIKDLSSANNSELLANAGSTLSEIDEARKRLARRGRKPTPITGTDEWKQQRRDSHKEVERRRRQSINQAINSLSQLLPVKESSKAAILARAGEYIEKLKETENANIEKWTLQKLLSEQNASQLATANEKLQDELGNAYKEIDYLKRLLKKNNITIPNDETDHGENMNIDKKD